jgi:HEPN domain-containing protein
LFLRRFKVEVGIVLDAGEYERWMRSARRTLLSARAELNSGIDTYNWVCFKAHQAAEKALKALLWGSGIPVIGHMLPKLLSEISERTGLQVPDDIYEAVMALNKYYIPTRYPDAWSEGIPEEYFTRREAEDAVEKADRIIRWVEEQWRRLLRKGGGC